MLEVLGIKNKNVPDKKEEWKAIYNMDEAQHDEVISKLKQEHFNYADNDNDSAKTVYNNFLKDTKPVIDDLAKTEDSILLRFYGGYGFDEFDPENSKKLLFDRAKEKAEKYKGLVKPIL